MIVSGSKRLQNKDFIPTHFKKKGVSLYDRRGFTLIELLVVVAIISLLSTVVLSSLNSARAKARDALRTSDMQQLLIALELYYDDNGQYPANPSGICGTCIEGGWAGVLSSYISELPTDPTLAGTNQGYRYRFSNVDGRQSYTMLVRLEKNNGWCSINRGLGHDSWNYSNGVNFPLCSF